MTGENGKTRRLCPSDIIVQVLQGCCYDVYLCGNTIFGFGFARPVDYQCHARPLVRFMLPMQPCTNIGIRQWYIITNIFMTHTSNYRNTFTRLFNNHNIAFFLHRFVRFISLYVER